MACSASSIRVVVQCLPCNRDPSTRERRGPYRLCSWGFFDVGQFRLDCTRFGLDFPENFESDHVNIKQAFADWKGVRRCGMTAALDLLGLPLAGTHHRGIDDARNIARIVQQTLPNVVVA